MPQPLIPATGKTVRLDAFDPRNRNLAKEMKKNDARELVRANVLRLQDLSYRLYAENRRSLLIVLQGMDTAGKDGTIRHVMRGVNPQMCQVTSFKQPSIEELDHDFLWRIHRAAPRRGNIGIFNRSQYEDVLVVRVHELAPKEVWQARYEMINTFEQMLSDGSTTILKFFLHISKKEQLERLRARLKDPTKRWKFSLKDVEERKLWDDYQRAYEDVLSKCNTSHAPWHIVPADRKWYRNIVISRTIIETLEKMNPQFPPEPPDLPEDL